MIIKYKCNKCDNSIKKYYKPGDIQQGFLNCQCSGVLERQVPDFGMSSFETIDNGFMQKKVELRKDALEKSKELGDNYIKEMNARESILKKDDE